MKLWPVILLCAIFTLGTKAFAGGPPYDPTSDLIRAFGSQCSSMGELTSAALTQSDALKNVIASIYNDPACQGVIQNADALSADIKTSLQANNPLQQIQAQNQVTILQAAITQQQQALAQTTDPTAQAAINSNILLLQENLQTANANLLTQQATLAAYSQQRVYDSISALQNHGSAFLDGLANSQACINNHPNVLMEAGSQILQLSSEWAGSIVGSALLAAGGLVDHFVQFLRNGQLNRDLADLMTARMGLALGCTMEGLASTYCGARDTQLLINANRAIQEHPPHASTISDGIAILTRDLGSFVDFVNKINNGSPASSSADAIKKTSAITLLSTVESMKIDAQAMISGEQQEYTNAKSQQDREGIVRQLISSLKMTYGLGFEPGMGGGTRRSLADSQRNVE